MGTTHCETEKYASKQGLQEGRGNLNALAGTAEDGEGRAPDCVSFFASLYAPPPPPLPLHLSGLRSQQAGPDAAASLLGYRGRRLSRRTR